VTEAWSHETLFVWLRTLESGRGCLFLKVNVLQSYKTFATIQLVTSQKTQILSDRHPCENLCKFHIFTYTTDIKHPWLLFTSCLFSD